MSLALTFPEFPLASLSVEELYVRFGSLIRARCCQILRDEAAAEDATQEVFFRVQEHLPGIGGERHAFAWLYRTATNHCLNELRNGRIHASLIAGALGSPARDAEQRFSDRDLVARIVRQLPDGLARVAWLYHVDEMGQAEIGEICGVARRTVISWLGRFAEQARTFIERNAR